MSEEPLRAPLRLTFVAGARPNFMKVAPLLRAAASRAGVVARLVHTGQHYDERMSELFFRELGMPRPDASLGVGSGGHAVQTARVMIAFDEELDAHPTDRVVVVGDVNSTLACALVAVKRGIPCAHVEAGLRSGDRSMPEEINRIVADHVCDPLFTTEPAADANLAREGIPAGRIRFVGNTMIDTLLAHRDRARAGRAPERFGLEPRAYALATLHRPSNVDDPEAARRSLRILEESAARMPTLLPLHPRTRAAFERHGLLGALEAIPRLRVVEPLGYLDFLGLMDAARVVLTDSGGVQEETTALGVPCITCRDTTERPITVERGTNVLAGTDPEAVARALDALPEGPPDDSTARPEGWDGRAAERILDELERGVR